MREKKINKLMMQ